MDPVTGHPWRVIIGTSKLLLYLRFFFSVETLKHTQLVSSPNTFQICVAPHVKSSSLSVQFRLRLFLRFIRLLSDPPLLSIANRALSSSKLQFEFIFNGLR